MDFPGRKITFKNQRLLKNFYRIFFLIFRILNLSYCSCNFIIICLSWLIYDFLSKMVYFCMVFGLDILQDQPALKKSLKIFIGFVQMNLLWALRVEFCNKTDKNFGN